MGFEVRAVARYIHMSPMKIRRVVDMVRGKPVEEALAILDFTPKAAAKPVAALIRSAIANAEENFGLSREDLFISRIHADPGPMMKRARFGARGRFKPILKRSAHITVTLNEMEE